MLTTAPTGAFRGLKPVIFGFLITQKFAATASAPPPLVTLMGPVVAPAGT